MFKNIFFAFFFLLAHLSEAQLQSSENPSSPVIDSISNIEFKKINDSVALKLDIYYPAKRDIQKGVILYLHGGAWALGDKTPFRVGYRKAIIDTLLSQNFTIISAQYRLISKDLHFPKPVEDGKDALRWIHKNATQYGSNTHYIGIWGDSAGGQLAMLTAYSTDDDFPGDADLKKYSSKVNFVLNNYGPVEMNSIFRTDASPVTLFLFKTFAKKIFDIRQKLIRGITGVDVAKDRTKVRTLLSLYSPIRYIGHGTVPTLTLQGKKDNTVPVAQAEILHKKLDEFGIPNELKIYPNANHGFSNLDAAEEADAAARMLNFVLKYQP